MATQPRDLGDQNTSKESEELTREKLIMKYKTLMALTNKIKTARNEALDENNTLKQEIETTNEKIKVLTKQNATAEEMLAVLTEQKLKMAMEIDDMKKEKQNYHNNIKEMVNRELEKYKLENGNIKKENEDLLIKLQEKDKNEVQLHNDIKKLHENNQNVIVLCSNIRKEKLELENQLEEIYSRLSNLENEKVNVFEILSKQFNKHFEDLNSIKQFFEFELKTYCNYQCAEEINVLLDKNLNLKTNVEQLNESINSLIKEKECAETNITNLTLKLDKLKSELAIVTSDRDQIMNNLESVRLETKNLIENSEKLADELEILKADKIKNEFEMISLINSKNDEIERSRNQIVDLQNQYDDIKISLMSCKEYMHILDTKKCNCVKENEDTNNENVNRILFGINKLKKIGNKFSNISETVQNINISLLEKEVQTNEAELLHVLNEFDKVSAMEDEGQCSESKCSCIVLKAIGVKLKECTVNYERLIEDLKHDLQTLKEQHKIDNASEGLKDELIQPINNERAIYSQLLDYKDAEMESILSKVEEYYTLNNLLEKKLILCREELSCALTQLHKAEELGELMQREITSLQRHLCEVISEREMLNEILNDKVETIIKLDEELVVEQTKSTKLLNDLENSKLELNITKNALDEKTKLDESVTVMTKVTELKNSNHKLITENDSLKNSIENIIKQKEEEKLKEKEDKNKLVLELNNFNEELQNKLINLEKANRGLGGKLLNCKTNVVDFRHEVTKLRSQFVELQKDASTNLLSLQTLNQECLALVYEQNSQHSEENQGKEKIIDEKEKTEEVQQIMFDKECQVNEENELTSSKTFSLDDLSEQNSAKIQALETTLAISKQELTTTQIEIKQLREDFHSYRLRAQTLLAKQKSELGSQKEKEAKEQVEKLNNELENLRSKMEIILMEDETLKNRLSTLQSEKEMIDKKYEDISRALHQKINDYDALNIEYNAFKLSTDTLIHNGKILLEEKYQSEISEKEAIINKLKFELKEKHLANPNDDKTEDVLECSQSVHNMGDVLQEREEGEGSETAATTFIDRHEFVPLDVLINNSGEDEDNQVAALQEQLNILTAELTSHDIRSKHLSSLLREAEKESARNAQQNSVLKEEVRRLERCLERQPLVANTEYLKNVVFKFLTLQSADERSRLVTVLDSILKLSPAEVQKLIEIARGEGATSRWSNYLQSWTGFG